MLPDEARRCFNFGVYSRCEICLIYCRISPSRAAEGQGSNIHYSTAGLRLNAEARAAMTREGLEKVMIGNHAV
jgi:hypothetical protein